VWMKLTEPIEDVRSFYELRAAKSLAPSGAQRRAALN